MGYVNEAAKNNSALRKQIENSQLGSGSGRRPIGEAKKAVIAIMPVPELNTIAINNGNVNSTAKKDGMNRNGSSHLA